MGVSKALIDLGLEVSVYHRFNQNALFEKDGVKYFLMNDNIMTRPEMVSKSNFIPQ
ncbi:MAG: hypothetical protein MZV64_74025 [Ignavibacteriales bacterium]|nr:hypothetical protein [Ignavibacteriales bacterium]